MSSSTSSSRRGVEPAALALGIAVCTLAVIGTLGLLRRQAVPVAPPPPLCDVVLVGDSHMRQGVIPSVLSQALGGARVYNAAVPGMPLSPEYFEHAASLLDPASKEKCIAIGISLTTQKAPLRHRRREFTHTEGMLGGVERTAARAWKSWLREYAPPSQEPRVRVSTLHPDGWRERDFIERRDPHQSVAEERWNLLANPFDQFMVQANHDALVELARRGVRVVIFPLPSDVEVVEPMTEEWAGMTAVDYAGAICPEGGLIVPLTFHPNDTYDGHHLHPDAARATSAELAAALATWLNAR